MPRVIETTVYTYDELEPKAQEKARDWFRESSASDNFFAESVVEDFVTIAKACGLSLGSLHSKRESDAVYWSGFSSQGDGASFDASWHAANVNVAPILADYPAKYTDADGNEQESRGNARLHPILKGFAALAAQYPEASGTVVKLHKYHNLVCEFNVYEFNSEIEEIDAAEASDTFKELCSDLANWLYRTLETEYEYQNSDEVVADNIRANEYEFTAEGERS